MNILSPEILAGIAMGCVTGIATVVASGLTAYISVRERLTRLETQMHEVRDGVWTLLERREQKAHVPAQFRKP